MFQLSQRPIRTQLTALLAVAVMFLVSVAGVGAWALMRSASIASTSNDVHVPRQRASNELLQAVSARAIAARNLVLAVDPAVRDVELAKIKQAHEATQAAVKQLQALTADAGAEDRQLVGAVVAAEAEYGPVALKITGVAAGGASQQAATMIIEECRPLLEKLEKAVAALLTHEAAQTQADHDGLMADTSAAISWVAALGVGALVLLVWLGFVITRGLVGSSRAALQAVEKMAAGDMSLRLQATGESEPQRVLRSLDGMATRLREVLGTVRSASDQIATASEEVAKGSLDLSSRTEQAASNLEETAASMEQMTATVQQSSNSARQANQLAGESADVARRGGDVVNQVVQTMGDISKSSGRIGEIIGVIDGIAFQTNILALNAAVEAARAGEQGRGFAVVAGEVRNLAQRSAQAAKEIKQLIEDSNQQVSGGTRLVQEAGGTIAEVVDNARRVSSIVSEIMASSTEQADGVTQINVAVTQLDHMTQQNAALVEQTSAAAESLKEQARQLSSAVSVFRLTA
ncbi:methyl-accepting chemotaxis protein [Hydrogenophaga sp. BPS33]|uniref:methyl-accepting chemotaxis protein n=1 Tax=Hydrogenophaga sp. BPS33 TaxID=2651974 RepID=UPI0013204BBF|nr:methyl-accepting chemotaxis protein [Hydrogenophaga sp. BPS33]QHE84423.1 methyl-accepting chemotaxis protein [Hydrogenophaga sp. BPS33]